MRQKIFHFSFSLFFLCNIVCLLLPKQLYALVSSGGTYGLQSYTIGSGGGKGNGTSYSMNGAVGDNTNKGAGGTYRLGNGLAYMLKVNVPGAPTVTDPANNYDRLKIVLNTSNNPTDTLYAVSVSTDNFASNVTYIKSDNTLGATLALTDYRTYSGGGGFGGSSGIFVSPLHPNTTYYFKVRARQGNYTESEWGGVSSVATANSSLTFTISSSTVTFAALNAGNSYTDSGQSTTVTTSTNAYNGYSVYAHETQSLTKSGGGTIADYSSPNSSPTSWSGTGFGYTTSDANLGGSGGTNRFSSGTKYAGLTTANFGDIVADDPGPVQNAAISNEAFIISYRITASATTAPGTYTNTIIYSIAPAY